MADFITPALEAVKAVVDIDALRINLVGVEFAASIGALVGLGLFYKLVWKPFLADWLSGAKNAVKEALNH